MGLDQVLADLRGEAAVLRRRGHELQARTLEDAADRVAASCPDYLRWISIEDARTRSGKSLEWLRGRAADWEPMGHARREGRKWFFRAIVVPIAPLRAIERRRGELSA